MPDKQAETQTQPLVLQNEQPENGFNMDSIKSQSTVRRQLKQPIRLTS